MMQRFSPRPASAIYATQLAEDNLEQAARDFLGKLCGRALPREEQFIIITDAREGEQTAYLGDWLVWEGPTRKVLDNNQFHTMYTEYEL